MHNKMHSNVEQIHSQVVEYSNETVFIHADHQILYINESGATYLKDTKEGLICSCVLELIQEGSRESIKERIQKTIEKGVPPEVREERIFKWDGTMADVELHCHPVTFDNKKAIQTTFRDITARKEKERQHQRQVMELSTPIVPVLEGIYVLPLVGAIDAERAKHLLDKVPSKVQEMDVEILIIDFSGIYTFDEAISNYIRKIHDVLELLGVRPIFTGVRQDLTQSVVQVGVDLSSTETFATVQEALKYHGITRNQI